MNGSHRAAEQAQILLALYEAIQYTLKYMMGCITYIYIYAFHNTIPMLGFVGGGILQGTPRFPKLTP